MTKILNAFLFIFLTIGTSQLLKAQENDHADFHPHHMLGIVLSHTQISQGIQANGDRKWLALPSIGINYNYKFSPKWAIGLHNDIVTEDYAVEEHLRSGGGNKVLERAFPVASAVVASFKPGKHFSYMLGTGGEFAHTGSFFLVRVGIEYGYHITDKWELNANLVNDIKINAYNSFAYGIGITKVF
jgi:hypothetical protein